jgi:hypothetical protein
MSVYGRDAQSLFPVVDDEVAVDLEAEAVRAPADHRSLRRQQPERRHCEASSDSATTAGGSPGRTFGSWRSRCGAWSPSWSPFVSRPCGPCVALVVTDTAGLATRSPRDHPAGPPGPSGWATVRRAARPEDRRIRVACAAERRRPCASSRALRGSPGPDAGPDSCPPMGHLSSRPYDRLGVPTRAGIYRRLRTEGQPRLGPRGRRHVRAPPQRRAQPPRQLADAGLVVTGTRKHPGGGRPAKVYVAREQAASDPRPAGPAGQPARGPHHRAADRRAGRAPREARLLAEDQGRKLVAADAGRADTRDFEAAAVIAVEALRAAFPEVRSPPSTDDVAVVEGLEVGPASWSARWTARSATRWRPGSCAGALAAAGAPAEVTARGGRVRAELDEAGLGAQPSPVATVDARGETYQRGVVAAMRAIVPLRPGDHLEVLTDGQGAPPPTPAGRTAPATRSSTSPASATSRAAPPSACCCARPPLTRGDPDAPNPPTDPPPTPLDLPDLPWHDATTSRSSPTTARLLIDVRGPRFGAAITTSCSRWRSSCRARSGVALVAWQWLAFAISTVAGLAWSPYGNLFRFVKRRFDLGPPRRPSRGAAAVRAGVRARGRHVALVAVRPRCDDGRVDRRRGRPRAVDAAGRHRDLRRLRALPRRPAWVAVDAALHLGLAEAHRVHAGADAVPRRPWAGGSSPARAACRAPTTCGASSTARPTSATSRPDVAGPSRGRWLAARAAAGSRADLHDRVSDGHTAGGCRDAARAGSEVPGWRAERFRLVVPLGGLAGCRRRTGPDRTG